MYELGLRHTRATLTLQIGEYGRLPFDINVIRTVLFSRSPRGLINARDELIELLKAGLVGQYDPVSATRVWHEVAAAPEQGPPEADQPAAPSDQDQDPPGFLDLVAEGEAQQEAWTDSLLAINEEIVALGNLAQAATNEMKRSDARGGGMRGRLTVAAKYATQLEQVAEGSNNMWQVTQTL